MSLTSIVFADFAPCSDGIYPFDREILFTKISTYIAENLPPHCGVIHASPKEGFLPFHEAISEEALGEAEDVLMIFGAYADLCGKTLERLLGQHQRSGAAVSFLLCESAGYHEYAALKNANGSIKLVGSSDGDCALKVLLFNKKALLSLLPIDKDATPFDLANSLLHADCPSDSVYADATIEISDAVSAYEATRKLQMTINFEHMARGVFILNPDQTYISPGCIIRSGATILPGTILQRSQIGKGCVIGPNAYIVRSQIGNGTSVNTSQIFESSVGSDTAVGPFAYIRPQSEIGSHVKIGDFVEIKKSKIGDGTKVSHLTYIGDADVGQNVNFGCGTVVVNYDGYHKNLTTVGDNAFIGCNTNLVSPVTVGEGAFTAAGSTITKDVPPGALAVARAKQEHREGWADARRKQNQKK